MSPKSLLGKKVIKRNNAKAKVKATNLLDADYRFEQEANGITQIQRLYHAGRTVSVSISWEF